MSVLKYEEYTAIYYIRPLALVGWVVDGGLLPWATSGDIVTLGVGHGWCYPIAVFLIIPAVE